MYVCIINNSEYDSIVILELKSKGKFYSLHWGSIQKLIKSLISLFPWPKGEQSSLTFHLNYVVQSNYVHATMYSIIKL